MAREREKVKIEVSVGTRYVGSYVKDIIEIDDEDIADMTETGRDDYLDEITREWMFDEIDYGWKIVDAKS